ncbi:hypothetical protein CK203_068213 [Vitis vinifera]|uniref:Uncharacterized protein n=1 Tax=Vitis vinifera TaxID=29760 RepID=A0A438E1H1_VITVI|nr:hypothetical protein CK203_068213 [Vitis vinifera]
MASPQGARPRTNGKLTTILSIDGGRIRGIVPAVILKGSIVTALLTTPYPLPNDSNGSRTNCPRQAKDIQKFYNEHGMEIFAKKEDPVETSKSDSLLTRLTELIVSGAETVLNFLLNHRYGPSHLSEKVNEQLGEI